jgi:hypothetical protein
MTFQFAKRRRYFLPAQPAQMIGSFAALACALVLAACSNDFEPWRLRLARSVAEALEGIVASAVLVRRRFAAGNGRGGLYRRQFDRYLATPAARCARPG